MTISRNASRAIAKPHAGHTLRQGPAGARRRRGYSLRANAARTGRRVSFSPGSLSRAVSAGQIAGDARWLPVDFDPRSRTVGFVRTGWAQLAAQPFLDMRWDRRALPQTRIAAHELFAAASGRGRCNFIWHTGFCCSTLLAQAITAQGRNLSLCEPKVLVDLADVKRAGMFLLDRELANLPATVLPLLSRPFEDGAATTLKPAPAANFLLAEAASLTSGKMLFLFSDCRSFVLSVARKGEEGRQYARSMFAVLLRSGHLGPEWHGPRLWDLSDLQIAAFVWHLQMEQFRRGWAALGDGRASALDCDTLLDAPQETLCALGRFFEVALPEEHVARTGPMFRRNAKNPGKPFDARTRREEHEAAAARLGADLDRAVAWSYDACPQTPRGVPLPAALIATDKAYQP